MDILLMVLTAAITGAAVTLLSKREGIGWWMGDQIAAFLGGCFGAYMVHTVNMHKMLEYDLFWTVVFTAGGALTMLTLTNMMFGGETDESPAYLQLATYEDDMMVEEPLVEAVPERQLPRAA